MRFNFISEYHLFDRKVTWAEAVIDCAKRGMELALPRNRRQYERLKDKLGRNMNDEDVWIAATDFHHERIFSDLKGFFTHEIVLHEIVYLSILKLLTRNFELRSMSQVTYTVYDIRYIILDVSYILKFSSRLNQF